MCEIVTNRAKLSNKVPHTNFTEERIEELSSLLFKRLEEEGGIGLAANQIGINERMAVIHVKRHNNAEKQDPDRYKIVLVNPRIVDKSDRTVVYKEGCLSFPNTKEEPKETVRWQSITVECDNYEGRLVFGPSNWNFEDPSLNKDNPWANAREFWSDLGMLECVVAQHEIAHLDGYTIYDFLKNPPVEKKKEPGRNEKVMFINKETGESKFTKYKKGRKLLNQGWELV